MSLQVIFSVYAPGLGEIQAFSAGDDQTLICQNTTVVEATIIGNPANHFFVWEQLDGSPVTWLNDKHLPFQYSSTDPDWTKVNDSLYKTRVHLTRTSPDDFTLRFWIDKRANLERFDDITLWGTPTSTALTYNNGNATSLSFGIGPSDRRTPASSVAMVPDFGQDGVGTVTFDLMMRWLPPVADASLVEKIDIEVVDIPYAWTVVTTLIRDATSYGPLLPGRTYRLRYYFIENTNNIEEYQTWFYSGSLPALFRADTTVASALSISYPAPGVAIPDATGYVSGYTVLERTLLVQNYQSDGDAIVNAAIGAATGIINTYTVLVKTLLLLPTEQSDGDAVANVIIPGATGYVSAYNVLALGGVTIGG